MFKPNLFDPVGVTKKRSGSKRSDLSEEDPAAGAVDDRAPPAQPEPEPELPDRLGNTDWCMCGQCIPMATERECVCCRELGEVVDRRRTDAQGVTYDCVTQNPAFHWVVIFRDSLETALVGMRRAVSRRPPLPGADIPSRLYRLVAYQQFTHWTHGYLGKHNRRVIPACVVRRIREAYPEPDGQYVGFLEAEEEMPWPV